MSKVLINLKYHYDFTWKNSNKIQMLLKNRIDFDESPLQTFSSAPQSGFDNVILSTVKKKNKYIIEICTAYLIFAVQK